MDPGPEEKENLVRGDMERFTFVWHSIFITLIESVETKLTGMNLSDCLRATGAYQQESLKYTERRNISVFQCSSTYLSQSNTLQTTCYWRWYRQFYPPFGEIYIKSKYFLSWKMIWNVFFSLSRRTLNIEYMLMQRRIQRKKFGFEIWRKQDQKE